MKRCPVCNNGGAVVSVTRPEIPVLQNVVYPTEVRAQGAQCGAFALATCDHCGFSYNAEFNADLIVYDERYDNHVASDAFRQYYRSLAARLNEKLKLAGGTVYEVGCGNGEFLKTLCAVESRVRAVGIDPSCSPETGKKYELIRAPFSREAFNQNGDTKLVLLRHVLEHLDQPVQFLRSLRQAIPSAPLYVEVPDLSWILQNNAFWDFCYEHCNYFTPHSLAIALSQAGFRVVEQDVAFGGQYLWAICEPESLADVPTRVDHSALQSLVTYAAREATLLQEMALKAQREQGLILWGMATKGVMLSNIMPTGSILGGVDMNLAKQGQFCARSATGIHPPTWLNEARPGAHVLVMNPNYLDEIREFGARFGDSLCFESV